MPPAGAFLFANASNPPSLRLSVSPFHREIHAVAMHNGPGNDGWRKIFADDGQDLDLLATPGHTPAQRVMHTSDAFFRRFLYLWLGFGVLACIYTLFWAREALYAAVITLVAGLAAKLCLHTGHTVIARWLFVLPLSITTAMAPWAVNGLRTPVLANMPMMLVLAGWMLGRRAMWVMACAFMVALTALWGLEQLGLWHMPVPLRGIDLWFIVLGLSVLACVIVMSELIGNYQADMQRETAWQERLSSTLQFASLVIDCSPVPIRVFNQAGRCVAVNEAYAQLIGVSRTLLLEESLYGEALQNTTGLAADCQQALVSGQPLQREVQAETAEGRQLWLQAHLVPFAREGQRYLLAHFIDLTERHRATQELQQLAFHDSLTGLANRRLFFEHLRHAMERCRRSGEWGAVLMLDLNRFKQLNDQHGHEAGDHLLVEVARRITSGIRASDVVARLGGDEFTVLLHPLGSTAEQAHQHADVVRSKLQALLAQPYALPGVTHHGSASIGCAWIDPLCSLDVEAVLRQADAQMYAAKQALQAPAAASPSHAADATATDSGAPLAQ